MNDVVYVMINSILAKEGRQKKIIEEFKLDDILSNNEWVKENVEGDNENVGLNDAPNSNKDDVHLVESQAQNDDFVVPPLRGGCSY